MLEPNTFSKLDFSHVVTFAELSHIHVLGCLGEPGIGKSNEISSAIELMQTETQSTGNVLFLVDLERYRDKQYLADQVLETDAYRSWLSGTSKLYIFMENLDRLPISAHTFSADLKEIFDSTSLNRLFLRFVSRTFDWPASLESEMSSMFNIIESRDRIGIYELAPLTRENVETAALAEGFETLRFLDDIERADIVPLAARPVTLRFLINKYRFGGTLPATAVELYKDGCELLSSECNLELHESGKTGQYTAFQRLAAASRIAALMLLCQKYAVWTGVDDGRVPKEDMKLEAFVGDTVAFEDVDVEITKELVSETLSYGLFTSRGLHRSGFTHQTYAEFLAALFLTENKVNETQLLSLIVHPEDQDGAIVPQLAGVAAWLAVMNTSIFNYLVTREPEILLLGDLDILSDQSRSCLVTELLKRIEFGQAPARTLQLRYPKLAHNGLSSQLRVILEDSNRSQTLKHEIVQIASACRLSDLGPSLMNLALDKKTSVHLRAAAACAAGELENPENVKKFIQLTMDDMNEDPDDELKGALLGILFPTHLTASELFLRITPRKTKNYLGSYYYFLNYSLLEQLSISDYPVALEWLLANEQLEGSTKSHREPEEFCQKLMWLSFHHLSSAHVFQAFCKIVFVRLLAHRDVIGHVHKKEFYEVLSSNHGLRRSILEYLLRLATDSREVENTLGFCLAKLASVDDFIWFVNKLSDVTDVRARAILIQLAEYTYRTDKIEHIEIVWSAKMSHPDLARAFDWLFSSVDLGSPVAENLRMHFYDDKTSASNKLLEPSPQERILTRLAQSESALPQAWHDLTRQLALPQDAKDGDRFEDSYKIDVTDYPGWAVADALTRKRIVDAAYRFLIDERVEPLIEQSLETTKLSTFVISGCKALLLLKASDPGRYSSVPSDIWKRWQGGLLILPRSFNPTEQRLMDGLIRDAYERNPDGFNSLVMRRAMFEASTWQSLQVLDRIKKVLDDHLEDFLLNLATKEDQSIALTSQILSTLLEVGSNKVLNWAVDRIEQSRPPESQDSLTVTVYAQLVLKYSTEYWDLIWNGISEKPEFGYAVFNEVKRSLPSRFLSQLTSKQLYKLFDWLITNFPEEAAREDDVLSGWASPGDFIDEFRYSIPILLLNRATIEDCEALRDISNKYPQLADVRRMLDHAVESVRTKTWIPYEPKYILKLVKKSNVRLVASETELLSVVVSELLELQKQLQGHQPTNEQLWNEVPELWLTKLLGGTFSKSSQNKKKYLPKDETALCNYVVSHLTSRLERFGIIVNREVVIRFNPGSKGERTDICVEAAAFAEDVCAFRRLTVIIEAKGIWNDDVFTAMKTQLVDQYLREAQATAGVYLVGYFNCPQWAQSDPRFKKSKGRSLKDTIRLLEKQSAELRKEGTLVKVVVLDASLRSSLV